MHYTMLKSKSGIGFGCKIYWHGDAEIFFIEINNYKIK
jgi:hypothetical protein